jgi:mRNA-degrading endonuclease toxin of MazEF toxin-antitoxin module
MKWGEIYRTREKLSERGHKPGFYVVVSRDFIAGHEDITTVVCAPIYRDVLGLRTEVVVGAKDGLPRESAIRCDFLALMFKKKLTGFVGTLSADRQDELRRALAHALQLKV